jgi:hypothetical protein
MSLKKSNDDAIDNRRSLEEDNERLKGKAASLARRLKSYKEDKTNCQDAKLKEECNDLKLTIEYLQSKLQKARSDQQAEFKDVLEQNQDYKERIMKLNSELDLAKIHYKKDVQKRSDLLHKHMKSLGICKEITDKCQHCSTEIKNYQKKNKKRSRSNDRENANPNSSG